MKTQTRSKSMSEPTAVHSDGAAATNALREPATESEQRKEEWYALYNQLSEFMKQEPQKHPLYDLARESLVTGQSCDFYRGSVEDACKIMRIVDACKAATCEKNEALGEEKFHWEDMFFDMLRIRIGLNAKRALQRWPAEFVPNLLRDGDGAGAQTETPSSKRSK